MNFWRKLRKKLQILRRVLAKYESLEKEVKTLKGEVAKLTKQQKAQKKKCDELTQRLQMLSEQVSNAKVKQAESEQKHTGLSQKHMKLDQKYTELNQKYTELMKNHIDLIQEHTEVSQKYAGLEQLIVSESKKTKEASKNIQSISLQISDTKNVLNRLKNENKQMCQKLEYKIRRYMPEEKWTDAIVDWYYEVTGRTIDIHNPKTYNQIVQWAKIYDNTEIKSRLADKYEVREWVAERIGEEHLIPLLGTWDKAEDIDFEQLPDSFVLKCNHGCAYNIIVKDKANLDKIKTIKQLNDWLHEDFAFKGFELHYTRIKPCIIAEKYMLTDEMDDLPDYKFFCFGGKVFCSFTIDNIKERHSEGRLGIFDRDYNLMPYCRKDFKPITEQLEKPENYDKMIELAEILAEGFSHVRVDFYNIEGKIYFGEMTFSTGNGRGFFEPEEFDYILGEQWIKYLPELNYEERLKRLDNNI